MMPRYLFTLLLCVVLPTLVHGGQVREVGGYQIHYSALPTSFLTAEMAAHYGMVRSRTRGLLSIAVTRGELADRDGLPAQVQGRVINNVRQESLLSFRRHQEGSTVYYLAPFNFRDGELLIFQFDVIPQGSDQRIPIRFSREIHNRE